MDKIIIEVGSTCTKVDKFDGKNLQRLREKTIFFKKNYSIKGCILESDFEELVGLINDLKETYDDIYVCGTSIFRNLSEEERSSFLQKFESRTGEVFNIISQEEEGMLTVEGATRKVNSRCCVFVGGGGSTEISIYDGKIIESVNSPIGVMDILKEFPDLGEDYAKSSLKDVKEYIKSRLNLPKEKADVLILAGGGHEKFARLSGINYEKNTLYEDEFEPIMMDIDSRISETERFFTAISLNEIKTKVDDPNWWDATRHMCAFVLVVAEAIGAKYIIPTDIGMEHGILKK